MVKTLDQTVLTQKLVPLLSKIRTKEPAVMVWLTDPLHVRIDVYWWALDGHATRTRGDGVQG